ncbi:MAG TPA: aromatic-ring-hydroxylating dioxygenase subunit beta [Steroidobacteraceae bacterium]|nr:aromatic-ring-hydroxylating dioxygenase subunit beta [Steroidobacteraceae bacterium]
MSGSEPVERASLVDLVYREARLLDEKRFDEWYGLLTDDARYWMPLTRGQPNGETYTSLFYEDKLLLKVRIERLRHPNAFSQQQPSFCQHVLQQPEVELFEPAANHYVTRTPFVYFETQLDNQLVLAGVTWHHVTVSDGALRIRLKKIELVNCDAALPSIQLLL